MDMREAKELIRAGNLQKARDFLTQTLKKSPADVAARTLLFQVMLFYGEWEKAGRHCDMIAAQDEKAFFGVGMFKNLLQAEKERVEVMALSRRPSFLPKAPPYFEKYASALQSLADGDSHEAARFFGEIDADRSDITGTLNGVPFTGFKDTDAYLSGFLEVMVHERYLWIPFEAIRELAATEPESLFDLIWASCRITLRDGLTLNGYLPVLYPESGSAEDDRIKLGRLTDWRPLGGNFFRAVGQHVFDIGGRDVPLLEIREVLFDPHGPRDEEGRT